MFKIIYVVSKQVFNENCSYVYCAFKNEGDAKRFCEDMNKICTNGKYDYEEIELYNRLQEDEYGSD